MSAPGLSVRADASADTSTHTRIRDPRLLALARLLWIAIVLLGIGIFVATLPIQFNYFRSVCEVEPCPFDQLTPAQVSSLQQLGLSLDFYVQSISILEIAPFPLLVAVAVLIFWRKSDDWLALFVSLMLVTNAATFATSYTTIETLLVPVQPFWYWPNVLLNALGFGSFGILFYVFPDGRFVPRWTRWTALAWLVTITILSVRGFNVAGFALLLGLLVTLATSSAAQVYRYRQVSSPLQRQQTKWIVAGFAALLIVSLIGFAPLFIFPSLSPFQHGPLGPLYLIFFLYPLMALFLSLLPVTLALSMLRYRLWDVDLVINRSLVYGGLTLVLSVIFLFGLLLLQSVLGAVLGGEQTTTAAVISTALIVGLFNPTRHRLQRFVDRRFYRLNVGLDQLHPPKAAIANPGALSGTTLGSYQVLEPLGHGGMGEVYKAHQSGLERTVAIKVLPTHLAQEAEFRVRFEREARTVASLKHPNIVSIFDFGESEGKYYMVMEFIDGQELADYLRQCGRLPLDEARAVLGEIASALDYAHTQGLVHRDVKPSNVMLQAVTATGADTATRRAVLMDFGIIKLIGGSTGITKTGMVGTLDYMAPEQIRSAKEVDGRADVYALGVVGYQLLTGQLPFRGESAAAVLFAHLQQPAPDPCDVVPELPAATAKAVLKALAKQPEDRYATAGEFAAALG